MYLTCAIRHQRKPPAFRSVALCFSLAPHAAASASWQLSAGASNAQAWARKQRSSILPSALQVQACPQGRLVSYDAPLPPLEWSGISPWQDRSCCRLGKSRCTFHAINGRAALRLAFKWRAAASCATSSLSSLRTSVQSGAICTLPSQSCVGAWHCCISLPPGTAKQCMDACGMSSACCCCSRQPLHQVTLHQAWLLGAQHLQVEPYSSGSRAADL